LVTVRDASVICQRKHGPPILTGIVNQSATRTARVSRVFEDVGLVDEVRHSFHVAVWGMPFDCKLTSRVLGVTRTHKDDFARIEELWLEGTEGFTRRNAAILEKLARPGTTHQQQFIRERSPGILSELT
jgi:hypothetical protein